MSTKTPGVRLLRVTPGGRSLRQGVLRQAGQSHILQLTAIDEAGLRGLRTLFASEEAEKVGVELIPFGNLVSRVCSLARVPTTNIAQSGQVVASIADACRRLPEDSPIAPTAEMPGIHKALAETLATLRGYRLDPARLDLAAAGAAPHLAAKLRSLGFILRESGESLRALGREHLTAWMERTLETNPGDCDDPGHVALVVQGSLPPMVAAWIEWLARTPGRVTVIGEVHPGLPHLFRDLGGGFPDVEGELRIDEGSLASQIFVRGAARVTEPALEVVAAPDLLSECEWALRRCGVGLAAGVPAERVAVFARDLKSYAPVLHVAARRLGVHISLAWRAPLLSNRKVAFFLDLISALGSADVRALIRPMRSPYSGLSVEVQGVVENALRDLRRSGSGAWDDLNTVARALADEVAWLEPVLEWRAEAMGRPAEPSEWFDRIMALAELIPWQDAAAEFPQFSDRDGRAETAMQRAITERASIARVRRAAPMEYGTAVRWMRQAWEGADYSVPRQEDGVRVVASACELADCDLVVALGMLESVLPRRPREDPILGDLERCELSRLADLNPPLPTSSDEAAQEREEFIRVCGAPGRHLVLSYRVATGEKNNIPTAYIEEAKQVCASTTETIHSRTDFTAVPPTLAADVALDAAFATRRSLAEVDFVMPDIRAKFLWPSDRAFEPQQLRRAAQCGFRFLVRDQLRLQPARRQQLWNRLLDLPAKAELAVQPDAAAASAALSAALDDLIDSQVGKLAEWELAMIQSGGRRMISDWVAREFRARELWPRHGMRVNVPIDSPGMLNKAARDVSLTGSIPALGRMGPYALTRLYEAGAPNRLGRETSDATFLYYALWAVLTQGESRASAIEVETLGHFRRLFVLPREAGALPSDREFGLYASAVSAGDDDARAAVNVRARGLVRLAVDRARSGIVTPTPAADHCPGCGFGELCRRSADFGEGDDPFQDADA